MRLKGTVSAKRLAKQQRREMSLPEVLLWCEFQKRPSGLKFRRQAPAGPFSLDFYCAKLRLAIEVDGEAHGTGDRSARDAAREALCAERGVRVERIAAREVLADLDAVIRHICHLAKQPPPPRPSAAVPLPR